MMKRSAAMFTAHRTGTVFMVALVVLLAATLTMGAARQTSGTEFGSGGGKTRSGGDGAAEVLCW
jgi:hypothetical protein